MPQMKATTSCSSVVPRPPANCRFKVRTTVGRNPNRVQSSWGHPVSSFTPSCSKRFPGFLCALFGWGRGTTLGSTQAQLSQEKGELNRSGDVAAIKGLLHFLSSVYTAVQITKPMKDKECSESENVTFEVEVSHPRIDAFWTLERQPLKSGAKYKMESKDKQHKLTVLNAMKDEEGEYMFAAGEKTCSATLTVSGMLATSSPLGQLPPAFAD